MAFDETCSTLKFADRAKHVVGHAKLNEFVDDKVLLRRLERENAELKQAMATGNGGQVLGSTALREEVQQLRQSLFAEKKENDRLKTIFEKNGATADLIMPAGLRDGGADADYDTQLQNYQKWMDSLKVVGEDGELKNLDMTDRLALMERSIIKQSQELQRTKALFVADLRSAQAEIHSKSGLLDCANRTNRLIQFRLDECISALNEAGIEVPSTANGSNIPPGSPAPLMADLSTVLQEANAELCDVMGEFETKLALELADMFHHIKDDSSVDRQAVRMKCLECVRSHCDEFSASIIKGQEDLLKRAGSSNTVPVVIPSEGSPEDKMAKEVKRLVAEACQEGSAPNPTADTAKKVQEQEQRITAIISSLKNLVLRTVNSMSAVKKKADFEQSYQHFLRTLQELGIDIQKLDRSRTAPVPGESAAAPAPQPEEARTRSAPAAVPVAAAPAAVPPAAPQTIQQANQPKLPKQPKGPKAEQALESTVQQLINQEMKVIKQQLIEEEARKAKVVEDALPEHGEEEEVEAPSAAMGEKDPQATPSAMDPQPEAGPTVGVLDPTVAAELVSEANNAPLEEAEASEERSLSPAQEVTQSAIDPQPMSIDELFESQLAERRSREERPPLDSSVERKRRLLQEAAGEVLGAGVNVLGLTELITGAGSKPGGKSVIGIRAETAPPPVSIATPAPDPVAADESDEREQNQLDEVFEEEIKGEVEEDAEEGVDKEGVDEEVELEGTAEEGEVKVVAAPVQRVTPPPPPPSFKPPRAAPLQTQVEPPVQQTNSYMAIA